MSPVRRLERIAPWAAAFFALLGLMTATGCQAMPSAPASWAWPLHVFLLLAGFGGGLATMLRSAEIEAERWQVLSDDHLTSMEREYAHKEAERQRRMAGTLFLLVPVCCGYWVAYLLRQESGTWLTNLLVLTPVLGFLVGLLVGRRWEPPPPDWS